MPSIKRYVLVEQAGAALTVHARQGGEPWVTTVLEQGDVLALPELGIEISVAAIYEDVTFQPG